MTAVLCSYLKVRGSVRKMPECKICKAIFGKPNDLEKHLQLSKRCSDLYEFLKLGI